MKEFQIMKGSLKVDTPITQGVNSLLEPRTTCMHDLEINTSNLQDFLPLKNDMCTYMYLRNALQYTHK